VHPSQDRGLSVREAALLQGFPSDFTFAGSLDERFRQIGNAVPPRFAAFLGVHVLGELLAAGGKGQDAQKGIEKPVGSSFSRLIPALKAGYRNEVCVLRDSRAEL
jgi:DNA (cytosine-5)-methyltransferase 1